jgi:hypothetical protein
MASQFALPKSEARKKREQAAFDANKPSIAIPTGDTRAESYVPKAYSGDKDTYLAQRRMRGLADLVFGLPDITNTAINSAMDDLNYWGVPMPDYRLPSASQSAANLATEQTGAHIVPEADVSPQVRQQGANQQALMSMIPVDPTHAATAAAKEAMIIGPRALKFPGLFVKPAMEDLAAGKSAAETWRNWGIEKDIQGNPVAEISDRPSTLSNVEPPFTSSALSQPRETGGLSSHLYRPPPTLGENLNHPELFANYPTAQDVLHEARQTPPSGRVSGGYTRGEDLRGIGHEDYANEGKITAASPHTDPAHPDSPRGITIHEAQHKVQEIEDFPRGGSPNELGMYKRGEQIVKQARREYLSRIKNGDDPNTEDMQRLEELAANIKDDRSWAHIGYESQAGEVQARNAANRMDLSPQQRAAQPPSTTEDFPRHLQTVTPQSAPFKTAKEASPVSQEMADRDPLRAPAVHTRGNEPLIEKIYQTAAETPAEDLYKPATNPVFDTSGDPAAMTKEMVPQVSRMGDITPNIMPAKGYPRGGRINQITENQEAIAQQIARDLQQSGITIPFYGTAPVLQTLINQGVLRPEQAHQFMRDWAGQGAATSMRTETPQNLRNSSYLLFRRGQGDPLTPERQAEEAAGGRWGTYDIREKGKGIIQKPRLNRPGFQMLEEHAKRADEMANETIDPWWNTKPFLFREGWSGNMADVVADTHNIRSILDVYDRLFPGSLNRGWFKNDQAFRTYQEGGGFNKEGLLPIGDIQDTLPQPMIPGTGRGGQVEYPLISGPTRRAGEILGISPGEAQERMWFNYGPRTGLQSPLATIPDLLNSQIEATARATGMSPEAIMKLWAQRGIPLASNETPGQGTSSVA